eukprot:gnl/Chilomastix_cuspidata/7078.p1 GENE.gnl/Chilomastix_cuspidata/7078~~gnl/Chilomastix_cuspidata/7078.p1  ORF type:complete len:383 (-),score=24.07 gnl/Chilomastix_cuspidata/7078:52-1200(-)
MDISEQNKNDTKTETAMDGTEIIDIPDEVPNASILPESEYKSPTGLVVKASHQRVDCFFPQNVTRIVEAVSKNVSGRVKYTVKKVHSPHIRPPFYSTRENAGVYGGYIDYLIRYVIAYTFKKKCKDRRAMRFKRLAETELELRRKKGDFNQPGTCLGHLKEDSLQFMLKSIEAYTDCKKAPQDVLLDTFRASLCHSWSFSGIINEDRLPSHSLTDISDNASIIGKIRAFQKEYIPRWPQLNPTLGLSPICADADIITDDAVIEIKAGVRNNNKRNVLQMAFYDMLCRIQGHGPIQQYIVYSVLRGECVRIAPDMELAKRLIAKEVFESMKTLYSTVRQGQPAAAQNKSGAPIPRKKSPTGVPRTGESRKAAVECIGTESSED